MPEPPVYLDYMTVMAQLKGYASPGSKLTRLIQSGQLLKLRRGLYVPGSQTYYSRLTLANKIYGPSYISFEYALAYYGLIPERAEQITSATYHKNKDRVFYTPAGNYLYHYVNAKSYPYGVLRQEDQGHPFLMASPEKALCDTLSKKKGIDSLKSLADLLYQDLRIEPEALAALAWDDIAFLAPLYHQKIITLLWHFGQTCPHA